MNAPLAGTAEWRTVMERAGHRCQCTVKRHDTHRREQGGRCKHDATSARLIAGPAEPGPHPERRLTPIPVDDLVAWCPSCWDHEVNKAREAAKTARKRRAKAAPTLW